jgi:hypothetical protein
VIKLEDVHAVIDLETFGTEPSCVVIEIGILFFRLDDYGGMKILESFKGFANPYKQDKRTTTTETLLWHLRDKERAARVAHIHELIEKSPLLVYELDDLLGIVLASIDRHKPKHVWANSPTFDLRIIDNIIGNSSKLQTHKFVSYRLERDVRTAIQVLSKDHLEEIKNLAAQIYKIEESEEFHFHEALCDCYYEALIVQQFIIKFLPKADE